MNTRKSVKKPNEINKKAGKLAGRQANKQIQANRFACEVCDLFIFKWYGMRASSEYAR